MKKFLLPALVVLFLPLSSQVEDEKKWVFGIHGGFNQYNGDLGNGWYARDQAAYSFGGFSLTRFLNPSFDLTFLGSRGDIGHQSPWQMNQTNLDFLVRKTTTQLFVRYYPLGHERFFQPFVFAGGGLLFQRAMGDNYYPNQKRFDLAAPSAGFGFNVRLARWLRFQLQEIFIHTSADYVDYRDMGGNDLYLMHTAGLIFNFPNFSRNRGADKPDLVVDKCPKLPKELAAKRAEKKRLKTKAKMDRKKAQD